MMGGRVYGKLSSQTGGNSFQIIILKMIARNTQNNTEGSNDEYQEKD